MAQIDNPYCSRCQVSHKLGDHRAKAYRAAKGIPSEVVKGQAKSLTPALVAENRPLKVRSVKAGAVNRTMLTRANEVLSHKRKVKAEQMKRYRAGVKARKVAS